MSIKIKKISFQDIQCWLKAHWQLLVVLAVACMLILPNLGNRYLGQDEAETALLARSILHHGYPKAVDGVNMITQQGMRDSNANLVWTWHPWFSQYATAASFLLLGETNFSARLPAALFGLATIVLLYLGLVRFTKDKRLAFLAAFITLFNVSFLLHLRQARYYMPTAFFTLIIFFSLLAIERQKRRAILSFALASILLFYTSVLHFISIFPCALIYYFLFSSRRDIKRFLIACGAIVFAIFPWLVFIDFYRPVFTSQVESSLFSLGAMTLPLGEWLRRYVDRYIFPFSFLLFALILFPQKIKKIFEHPVATPAIILFVGGGAIFVINDWISFRYIAPFIPLAGIALAYLFREFFRWNFWIAAVCLLLFFGTDLFQQMYSVLVGTSERTLVTSPLKRYIYEITHDFDGPNEGIALFLEQNAKPDDIVATNTMDLSVIYYTGLKTIGGVTGRDYDKYPYPDWIIPRKTVNGSDLYEDLLPLYDKYEIDYPDIIDDTVPWYEYHHFRTPEGIDNVFIYHKPDDFDFQEP